MGAVASMVASAILLGYLCIVLLFWQGQWQLIFHPSNLIGATPASAGMIFDDVHFDATDTGQLQLNGWWIAAAANAPFMRLTVLYLHGTTGSLSNALPDIEALHGAGVQVFAFDPRGYGHSVWATPSEEQWNTDADAAYRYLTETRHIDPHTILVCGAGLGAAVAAETAHRHPLLPAMVLLDPQPPSVALLRSDPRSHLVPTGLLARDRFDPGPALASSGARKLFILDAAAPERTHYLQDAAPPKVAVRAAMHESLSAFSETPVRQAFQQFLESVMDGL